MEISTEWYNKMAERLTELEYKEAERQWISVSERLPELDETVLATTAWNDITIAWRIGISKWFIHEGNTNAETADILAWMPLPELYKGEKVSFEKGDRVTTKVIISKDGQEYIGEDEQ